MAERLTVDQKVVGSTPIAPPKLRLLNRESFFYHKLPHGWRAACFRSIFPTLLVALPSYGNCWIIQTEGMDHDK